MYICTPLLARFQALSRHSQCVNQDRCGHEIHAPLSHPVQQIVLFATRWSWCQELVCWNISGPPTIVVLHLRWDQAIYHFQSCTGGAVRDRNRCQRVQHTAEHDTTKPNMSMPASAKAALAATEPAEIQPSIPSFSIMVMNTSMVDFGNNSNRTAASRAC